MTATYLNSSLAFCLTAFVSGLVGFLFNKNWAYRFSLLFLVLGWLVLSIFLGLRWHEAGRVPLSNQYESMLFLLFSVLAIYFLLLSLTFPDLEGLVPWISGFAIIGMGVVSLLDASVEPLVPALQSNWLLVHVSTTLLGYGAFTLAFVAGLVYLVLDRRFRAEEEKKKVLDQFQYRTSALGFWLLALGIITGAIWANSAWGSYWSWDPKETWALVTWLYYAIAIHLRRTRGWRNKRFAWLNIVGFIFVVFTYFGVNYLLSGLHSYA